MDDITTAELVRLVESAGEEILKIYETDFDVEHKADESPLTQADLAAHATLVRGLKELTADIPILSEESEAVPYEVRQQWTTYWLIDPLDGTKEFVNRNGEFTVNLALIENGEPRIGFVGVPTQDRVYYGDVRRGQALCYHRKGQDLNGQALTPRTMRDQENLVVVASRSHGGEALDAYIGALEASFESVERKPVGSSLKLCILAAGDADLYPRLGPTSEWDIAAAHAVLTAAGGKVMTADGEPLRYNTKESLLNPDFVAVADARFEWNDILPPLPTTIR